MAPRTLVDVQMSGTASEPPAPPAPPAATGLDPATQVDLSDEDVHWDLGSSLSYSDYLRLDRLLDAQRPLSAEHDEMLFIIVHQVSELWMRLVLHELHGVIECVRRDQLDPSFKMLERVGRVQAQLLAVWEVLSSMTPADYSSFRNLLGRSSGFQSLQYRLLEFTLGNKHAEMLEAHRRDPAEYQLLRRALAAPSLYDEVLRLLSQRGYGVPASALSRDLTVAYQPSKQVTAAWLAVYHNADKDWDLYELAERLVDLDHRFQLWRFSHMKTVERIIGYKPGTGGTAGVSYLAKALRLRLFPELWEVRTSM
jgi:tryptophan 2,3-dioxygenase